MLGTVLTLQPGSPTPANRVDTLDKAAAVFDAANSKNAYDMLAAQLLAAKLNLRSGAPVICIIPVANEADAILAAAGYAGPGSTASPADKGAVLTLKDKLDDFNNNGCP